MVYVFYGARMTGESVGTSEEERKKLTAEQWARAWLVTM